MEFSVHSFTASLFYIGHVSRSDRTTAEHNKAPLTHDTEREARGARENKKIRRVATQAQQDSPLYKEKVEFSVHSFTTSLFYIGHVSRSDRVPSVARPL